MKTLNASEKISGYELYDYIMSGAEKIIDHESILNEINVFPIADSDTGSNLSFTMKSILAKAQRHPSASKTLQSISSIALEDSFGNSGTIFASYLLGLSEASQDKRALSLLEFALLASHGTNRAYNSIAKPVEGTMLTVMRAWSEFLVNHHADFKDLRALLDNAYDHAQLVLENTKNQLKELRANNVVDAGALGFVLFLEGILDFFDHGATRKYTYVKSADSKVIAHTGPLKFRYCSEFLVEAQATANETALKNELNRISDSIVLQRHNEHLKIHCHTNHPEDVSDLILNHGNIIRAKVDDMVAQSASGEPLQGRTNGRIGILTDTIADIPDAWIEKYRIVRLPLQIILGDNVFVDRLTLSSSGLKQILENNPLAPKSGQPGDNYIQKIIGQMLNQYDHVIGIFVSDKMSGLYDKVARVAREMNADRLHIINSRTNSAAQGLMIHTLIKGIEENVSVRRLIADIESTRNMYKIFVEIPDLHYATLSGRVPRIVGGIADMFNLKVVISIDLEGKGTVTRYRSFDHILKRVRDHSSIEKYCLVHSGNENAAHMYARVLTEILGRPPEFIEQVSTVVTAFVGDGSIGIGYKEVKS